MAAIVLTNSIWNTTNGTKASTSATYNVDELIVVFVANTGNVAPPTLTDNHADGLGTYTNITSALKNASADKMFVFVRNALIGSTAAAVITMTPGTTTGGGMIIARVSGMLRTGTNAVRASGNQENQAASGTPAPVFPQAALTANPCLGAIFNGTSPATLTPPGSWTEQKDLGYSTPTSGIEVATRDSGETGTTITWGSTSGSAFCSLIVELDTSAAPVLLPPIVNAAVSVQ